ncbi:trigger factor [Clostridium sp. CAG:1219]|nr:trigger factor [Clostridium sp. CAG:1219]
MEAEEFSKALDKAFEKNQKHFKVPGFRNGKVPRNVVEKVYGEGVLYESIIEDTVDEEYLKAVKENNLEIVARPELDIKQIGSGKDFIYTITTYVKPEINVKQYKGLEIKKVEAKVAAADVNAEIEKVREKNAVVEEITNRALKSGDISNIDFEGFCDGVAFEGGKAEKFDLTIGSNQFIPGFEEQLIGMKIGEEREINVKFPEEYHSKDLAGKDSMFKVKLNSIKEKKLAKIDDEFAKDVSEFQTLDEYKKDLKAKLLEAKKKQAEAEKETEVITKLVENVEGDIPDGMVETEIDNMLEQFNQNLAYQGLDIEKYCEYMGSSKEKFRETLKPNALRDVKLKLALEFVKKAENVTVEEKDIDDKIIELSKQYGDGSAEHLLKNENARAYMREQISQEKTLKIITESCIEK